MKHLSFLQSHRGFSLLEVALFIAIVSIGFASVINVMTGISSHSGDAMLRDAMTNALQQKMDEIRSAGYFSAPSYHEQNHIIHTGSFDIECNCSVVYLTQDLSDTSLSDQRVLQVDVAVEHPDYGTLNMLAVMTPLDNVTAQ